VAAGAVAVAVVSGGSSADPRTPPALPGLPPPFLGTTVIGDGGLSAAIDAYGDVVDLRPAPAGPALIDNPAARQATGTVPAETGIVPRVRIGDGPALPLWRADSVTQRYLPETNVVRTVARLGSARVKIVYAAHGNELGCLMRISTGGEIEVEVADSAAAPRLRCEDGRARRTVHEAIHSDRRWLSRARPLGHDAPAWAQALYERSLLTLRALTDRRTGAVAAGGRDGWAYVWPRDAGTAALAFAAAGYEGEARQVARFLAGLDLDGAARFHGDGTPVPGRAAQGDAAGWVAVAARATGLAPVSAAYADGPRADYQEGDPGDYLANAIAGGKGRPPGRSEAPALAEFETPRGLARRVGDPSDLDSAAAWAVEPFPNPALYPAARRTLLALAANGTRYGITPSADWDGADPWTAPTAWSAWGLAALGDQARRAGSRAIARRDRRAALQLLAALRRAATPAGALPERVDAGSGIPHSTTPLAWSHAFAILALHQLWP
jgi:hypothetical protein